MFLFTERLYFFILSNLAKRGIFQPVLSDIGTTRQLFQKENTDTIMASSTNQMRMSAEQLRSIATELVQSPAFQETLRRILTLENSMEPPSRIPAPTFNNVEEEGASLCHHHRRTATTRNQHQQHRPGLRVNPYTQNSTGLQSSFSPLTAAAGGRFVCLSLSFLI